MDKKHKKTDYTNPFDIMWRAIRILEGSFLHGQMEVEGAESRRKKFEAFEKNPNSEAFAFFLNWLDTLCARIFGLDRVQAGTEIRFIEIDENARQSGINNTYSFSVRHPLHYEIGPWLSGWMIDFHRKENDPVESARKTIGNLLQTWSGKETLTFETAPTAQELFTAMFGFGWYLPFKNADGSYTFPIQRLRQLLLTAHEAPSSYAVAKTTHPDKKKDLDSEFNRLMKAIDRLDDLDLNSFALSPFKDISTVNFRRVFQAAAWEALELEEKKKVIRAMWETLHPEGGFESYYPEFEAHWLRIYAGLNSPMANFAQPVFLIGLLIAHLLTQAYQQLGSYSEGEVWLQELAEMRHSQ